MSGIPQRENQLRRGQLWKRVGEAGAGSDWRDKMEREAGMVGLPNLKRRSLISIVWNLNDSISGHIAKGDSAC